MSEKSIDTLVSIYEQCNEHLREGDRKRDQILLFFTTILAIVIGGTDKVMLFFMEDMKDMVFIILFAITFIIGAIFIKILVGYRMWHLKYVLSCQVIQKLMLRVKEEKSQLSSKQAIVDILKLTMYPPNFFKMLKTMENMTINIFSTVNYINIVLIVVKVVGDNMELCGVILTVGYILYMLCVNGYSYNHINTFYKQVQDNKVNIWILDLI